MKLYLIKNKEFTFGADGGLEDKRIDIKAELFPSNDSFEYAKNLCDNIRSQTSINWDLTLDVGGFSNTRSRSTSSFHRTLTFTLKPAPVRDDDNGGLTQVSILKKLSTDFPEAKLKISVKEFRNFTNSYPFTKISSGSYPIENEEWKASVQFSVFSMGRLRSRSNGFNIHSYEVTYTDLLYASDSYSGKVSLSIKLPGNVLNSAMSLCSPWLQVNKRILDEHVASDIVITAGSGVEIKAHRNFLSVQSPVFQKMFESGMKESKSGKVDLSHMSGEAVNAFLAYLYYCDISAPNGNSGIAFELLCAADKYFVPRLDELMSNLLIEISSEKYSIDVAVQLFCFARKFTDASKQALKIKAVKVLKSKVDDLMNSPEFRELFKDEPEAAMELCKMSLEIA